uniref:Uncharacterized protein n=1 Tax=Trichobilharzia regenti TaxID=157069 RepID=A0AA85KHN3_TRIRE
TRIKPHFLIKVQNRKGKIRFHQPETSLEIFCTPQYEQQTKFGFSTQMSSQFFYTGQKLALRVSHEKDFQQVSADFHQHSPSLARY